MSSMHNMHGTTEPWRFIQEYGPLPGVYDEMLAGPGTLRPHCESFVASVETMGPQEFAVRRDNARRAIRENGVTYNVYGDPQGIDRPWELDMVPLLVSPDDWARLERGLVQRTTLLNLILADLYGPQTLLGAGLLPPSLVLSNPAFLRPCHGIRVPRGIHLHMHAVDLARSPTAMVGARRPHAGAVGRRLCARKPDRAARTACPKRFASAHVHRLASFFRAQRDTLMALAPDSAQTSQGRASDARSVQRNLLRARLPRALSRLHAGRRRRPDGARSPRLHQDARRPSARRRHLPPARRQLLRSARTARRLVARRGRPRRGRSCRQRRDRQRARLRRDRDGRHHAVPARRCAGTCSARSCCCRRSPPGGADSPDQLEYVLDHLDKLVIKPAFPDQRRRNRSSASDSATARSIARGRDCARGPTTSSRRSTSSSRRRRCGTSTEWSRGRSCSGPTWPPRAIRTR